MAPSDVSPAGGGSVAGLGSRRQDCGGFASNELRVTSDRSRLSLRGPASPHARSFRFNSKGASGCGTRVEPGTTTAVPGSPRATSPCRRGSLEQRFSEGGVQRRSLRGMPAGKLVESMRTGQAITWPYSSAGSRASRIFGGGAARASVSQASCSGTGTPLASPWTLSPRSPRTGVSVGACGADPCFQGSGEGPSSPRFPWPVSTTGPPPRDDDGLAPRITAAEVVALATAAGVEAEAEADRYSDDGPAPPRSPLYIENPWRVGLTPRIAEHGAKRLFPCHLVKPHATASGIGSAGPTLTGAGSERPGGLARVPSAGASSYDVVIPSATASPELTYRRMLPSSTASFSSTGSLPRTGPVFCAAESGSASSVPSPPGSPLGTRLQPQLLVSEQHEPASLAPPSEREARSPSARGGQDFYRGEEVAREPPAVALRRPDLSHGDGTADISSSPPTSLHRVATQPLIPPAGGGGGGTGGMGRACSGAKEGGRSAAAAGGAEAAAKLKALRRSLEKISHSAEERLRADLQQLDSRLAGNRRSLGSCSV